MTETPLYMQVADLARRLKDALERETAATRAQEALISRNVLLETENLEFCGVIRRQNREILDLRDQLKGEISHDRRVES